MPILAQLTALMDISLHDSHLPPADLTMRDADPIHPARKREQDVLRRNEIFLARTAALAGIGGWEIELATGELFCSAETYRIYGLDPNQQLDLDKAIRSFAPEARDALTAAMAACSRDGAPYDIEIPFIRANGERIWTRLIGSAEIADGRPFRISVLFQDIDKQVKERLALQQANDTLHLAQEAGHIGIWVWNLATNEVVGDAITHQLFGVQETDARTFLETWSACVHPDDRDNLAQALQDGASGNADYNTRFRIYHPGGPLRHIRATGTVSRDLSGKALRMTGAIWDVTREVTENLALKEATVRTRLAADSGGIGFWDWDILTGALVWDTQMHRLYDVDPDDRGFTYFAWTDRVHEEDRAGAEQQLADAVAGAGRFDTRFRVVWRDGSVHHIRAVGDVTRDAAQTPLHMLGVNWDVTKEATENLALQEVTTRMQRAAHHDLLTGLPNRLLLTDRIEQAVTMAQRHGNKVGVLFLDLDGFKHINDSLGHEVGDKLLISVSSRLLECVRGSDTVSRQGGDEFVALLAEMSGPADAGIIAERFLRAVAETHSIDGHDLQVTASIGISVYPRDGCDAATLFKAADTAMYKVKAGGRHGYQFFEEAMKAGAIERQYIEQNLRRAIRNSEFALHYQPKINIKTGAITGAEALIRWTHPQRGAIPPASFIPVAEDCGLIRTLGSWVLREACEQGRQWVEAGLPPLTMAVNISPIELDHADFLGDVRAILKDTGFEPKCLELEMTEGVLMKRAGSVEATLKTLKAMGLRLAIDDFGTGYSSLSYLTKFPVDTIKIDQSFVRQISTDPKETAIVTAVIGMAQSLNLVVVAEGVETREELEFLSNLGCDEAQGYYFSRPVAAAAFPRLLSDAATRQGRKPKVLL